MNTDDLLILSILTNSLGCDLNTAYNWLEAMEDRLTFCADLDEWDTIEELERFVLGFVADYSEP